MSKLIRGIMLIMALTGASSILHAQQAPAATRGQLLYTTHCITCHTTQMHWRNDKLAYDWDSLKFQVRRWQSNAGLQWDDGDVAEVTRYLNDTIYKYPQSDGRVSSSK